ncbi:MAG: CDGSH iron-sulfur domain-containing protein [Nevskia sp.]|nr:CDGSH iron-sulfur domain-containing protein [Nevskia sp.]
MQGRDAVLVFDARRCIHSRGCVLGEPGVFIANKPGEWLYPDAATPERLSLVALNCPSGAISVRRRDGVDETPPPVNVVRVRENGPLAFHGELDIAGYPPGDAAPYRATLCRCGRSRNKPFCDGSHTAAAFRASGEPDTRESQPLAVRDGKLRVQPLRNGPLEVSGSLEICAGTGRTVDRVSSARLCRCGQSGSKPFCDGSHAVAGFEADGG